MALAAPVKPVQEPERPSVRRPATVPLWRRAIAYSLKATIPLAILAVAGQIAWTLFLTAPVAERKARPRVPRLVEVVEVQPVTRGPVIEAWGEVAATRTLSLRPEISGTVVVLSDNLTPGGLVTGGELLIRIDDQAPRLSVAQAEAEIRQIEARILLEEGQQERAKRDLKRLPGTLTDAQRNLVLRVPYMDGLKGELAAAEAARDRALVELARTEIRAPFDAVVVAEQVALGAALSPGSEAASLVATDRFHVLLAVPVSALDWIDPAAGQTVRLVQPGVWPEGSYREGRVERMAAGLSATGRMAELVVSVEDPLARRPENRGKPPLLLGSYLQAAGEGRPVENAVALDRAWLRDGNTVWVMGADDKLEVRPVTIGWRGAERVLVSGGLNPGDRVVTTQLAVVAPGMELRLAGSGKTADGAKESGAEGSESGG